MATIPTTDKVFMVSNSTNTTYGGSAALQAMNEWYTMQDVIDTVTPASQSFNPLFTDASGTVAGMTVTGAYTMISPKICFFRIYVDFTNCTNFGTGQYQITLPFPSAETMRQANGTLHQNTGASLYHIAGITDINVDASVHKLYYSGSTTDLNWKFNTPVGATTVTSHFDISGTYEIA